MAALLLSCYSNPWTAPISGQLGGLWARPELAKWTQPHLLDDRNRSTDSRRGLGTRRQSHERLNDLQGEVPS